MKTSAVHYAVRARHRGNSSSAGKIVKRVSSRLRQQYAERSRTKTQTTTKKKSLFHKVRNDGPMSNSFTRWPQRLSSFKLGKLQKLISPQIIVSNQATRLEAPIGKQDFIRYGTAAAYPTLWSQSDLTQIYTGASAVAPDTQNPMTQKVYLKKGTMSLMITNQTNDVVNLSLYECVARRDTNTNMSGTQATFSPGDAWITGAQQMGASGVPLYIGSNPFQTPAFTNFFRVEKVTNVNLHTGGHHIHRSVSNLNHVLNDTIIQSLGTTSVAIKGITRYTMVVIHGYPANDSTTKSQVSTSAVSIDMVWKKQYEYYVLDRSTSRFDAANNLPTSFSVGGEIINDLTGVLASSVIA